jgi:hypothetical protein
MINNSVTGIVGAENWLKIVLSGKGIWDVWNKLGEVDKNFCLNIQR